MRDKELADVFVLELGWDVDGGESEREPRGLEKADLKRQEKELTAGWANLVADEFE